MAAIELVECGETFAVLRASLAALDGASRSDGSAAITHFDAHVARLPPDPGGRFATLSLPRAADSASSSCSWRVDAAEGVAVLEIFGLQPSTPHIVSAWALMAPSERGDPLRRCEFEPIVVVTLAPPCLVRCLTRSDIAATVAVARRDADGADATQSGLRVVGGRVSGSDAFEFQLRLTPLLTGGEGSLSRVPLVPLVFSVPLGDTTCTLAPLRPDTAYLCAVRARSLRSGYWGLNGETAVVTTLPPLQARVVAMTASLAMIKVQRAVSRLPQRLPSPFPRIADAGSEEQTRVLVRIAAKQQLQAEEFAVARGPSTPDDDDDDASSTSSSSSERGAGRSKSRSSQNGAEAEAEAAMRPTDEDDEETIIEQPDGPPVPITHLQPRTTYVLEYFALPSPTASAAAAAAAATEAEMRYIGRSIIITPMPKAHTPAAAAATARGETAAQAAADTAGLIVNEGCDDDGAASHARGTVPRPSQYEGSTSSGGADVPDGDRGRRDHMERLLRTVNPAVALTAQCSTETTVSLSWASNFMEVYSSALHGPGAKELIALSSGAFAKAKMVYCLRYCPLPRGEIDSPVAAVTDLEAWPLPALSHRNLRSLMTKPKRRVAGSPTAAAAAASSVATGSMSSPEKRHRPEQVTCRPVGDAIMCSQSVFVSAAPRRVVEQLAPDTRYCFFLAAAWLPHSLQSHPKGTCAAESVADDADESHCDQLRWFPFTAAAAALTLQAARSVELVRCTSEALELALRPSLAEVECARNGDDAVVRLAHDHAAQRRQQRCLFDLVPTAAAPCAAAAGRSEVSARSRATGTHRITGLKADGRYALSARMSAGAGEDFGSPSRPLHLVCFHASVLRVVAVDEGLRVEFHSPLLAASRADTRRALRAGDAGARREQVGAGWPISVAEASSSARQSCAPGLDPGTDPQGDFAGHDGDAAAGGSEGPGSSDIGSESALSFAAAPHVVSVRGFAVFTIPSRSVQHSVPLTDDELRAHCVELTNLAPATYAVSVRIVCVMKQDPIDGHSSGRRLTVPEAEADSSVGAARLRFDDLVDEALSGQYEAATGTVYRRHAPLPLRVSESAITLTAIAVAPALFQPASRCGGELGWTAGDSCCNDTLLGMVDAPPNPSAEPVFGRRGKLPRFPDFSGTASVNELTPEQDRQMQQLVEEHMTCRSNGDALSGEGSLRAAGRRELGVVQIELRMLHSGSVRTAEFLPAQEGEVTIEGLELDTCYAVRVRVQGRYTQSTGGLPNWSPFTPPLLMSTPPRLQLGCAAATEKAVTLAWRREIAGMPEPSPRRRRSCMLHSSPASPASSPRGVAMSLGGSPPRRLLREAGLVCHHVQPSGTVSDLRDTDSADAWRARRRLNHTQQQQLHYSRPSDDSYVARLYRNQEPYELHVQLLDGDGDRRARDVVLQSSVVLLHPNETALLVQNLYPGMRYCFRVRHHTAARESASAGAGRWSPWLTVCTLSDVSAIIPKLGMTYCTLRVTRAASEAAAALRRAAQEARGAGGAGEVSSEDTDGEPGEVVNSVLGYEARLRLRDAAARVRALSSGGTHALRRRDSSVTVRRRSADHRRGSAASASPLLEEHEELRDAALSSDATAPSQAERGRSGRSGGDVFVRDIACDSTEELFLDGLRCNCEYELAVRPNIAGGLNGQWSTMLRFRTMDFAHLAVVAAFEDQALLEWTEPTCHPVEVVHSASGAAATLQQGHPSIPFAVTRLELRVEGKRLLATTRSLVHSLQQQARDAPVTVERRQIDAAAATASNRPRRITIEGLFPDSIYLVSCRFLDSNDLWTPFGGDVRVMTRPALSLRLVSLGEYYAVAQLRRDPRCAESREAILQHAADTQAFHATQRHNQPLIAALTEQLASGEGFRSDDDQHRAMLALEDALVEVERVTDSNLFFSSDQFLATRRTTWDPTLIDVTEARLYDPADLRVEARVVADRVTAMTAITRDSVLGEAADSAPLDNAPIATLEAADVLSISGLRHRTRYSVAVRSIEFGGALLGVDTSALSAAAVGGERWQRGMWSDVCSFETLPPVSWSLVAAAETELLLEVARPFGRAATAGSMAAASAGTSSPDSDSWAPSNDRDAVASALAVHSSDAYELSVNGVVYGSTLRIPRGELRLLHIRRLPRDAFVRVALRNRFAISDWVRSARSRTGTTDTAPSGVSFHDGLTLRSRWQTARGPNFGLLRTLPRRPSIPVLYECRDGFVSFWWSLAVHAATKFPEHVAAEFGTHQAMQRQQGPPGEPGTQEAARPRGSHADDGSNTDDVQAECIPRTTLSQQCRLLLCSFDDEAEERRVLAASIDDALQRYGHRTLLVDPPAQPSAASAACLHPDTESDSDPPAAEWPTLDGNQTAEEGLDDEEGSPRIAAYTFVVEFARLWPEIAAHSPFTPLATVREPFVRVRLPQEQRGADGLTNAPLLFRVQARVAIGQHQSVSSTHSPCVSWRAPPPPPPVTALSVRVDPSAATAVVAFAYPSLRWHNQLHFRVFYGDAMTACSHTTELVLKELPPQQLCAFSVVAITTFGQSERRTFRTAMTAQNRVWRRAGSSSDAEGRRGTPPPVESASPSPRSPTLTALRELWEDVDADWEDEAAWAWPFPAPLSNDAFPPPVATQFHFDPDPMVRRARRHHVEEVVDLGRLPVLAGGGSRHTASLLPVAPPGACRWHLNFAAAMAAVADPRTTCTAPHPWWQQRAPDRARVQQQVSVARNEPLAAAHPSAPPTPSPPLLLLVSGGPRAAPQPPHLSQREETAAGGFPRRVCKPLLSASASRPLPGAVASGGGVHVPLSPRAPSARAASATPRKALGRRRSADASTMSFS